LRRRFGQQMTVVLLTAVTLLLSLVLDVGAQAPGATALLTEERVDVRRGLQNALGQVLQGRAVRVTLPAALEEDGVHTGTKVHIVAVHAGEDAVCYPLFATSDGHANAAPRLTHRGFAMKNKRRSGSFQGKEHLRNAPLADIGASPPPPPIPLHDRRCAYFVPCAPLPIVSADGIYLCS
jgi:hypothetical protein